MAPNEIVFSHADADHSKEALYTIDPDGTNKTQITFEQLLLFPALDNCYWRRERDSNPGLTVLHLIRDNTKARKRLEELIFQFHQKTPPDIHLP